MSVDQIISQLEKAGPYSNGSRILDKEIALIFGWVWRDDQWYFPETVERARKKKRRLSHFEAAVEIPHFTSCISDTMELFKKKPILRILWTGVRWDIGISVGGWFESFVSHHLPSGLCIAALKVKAYGRVI